MTSDALQILHKRYVNGDKRKEELLQAEREISNIAEQIYNLRIQAGLTQAQLAKLIGTTQSGISRLEDGDYNGQTLATLQRIAASLNQKVEVRFVPNSPCVCA